MKTNIYYFSGTGNSLKVATDIANRLDNAKLKPLPRLAEGSVTLDCECAGIVFPVHIYGIPLPVSRFVENLTSHGNCKYVFAIATYKSQPGAALLQLAKKLERHGIRLSAGFNITMPGNNTIYYNVELKDIQDKKFDSWDKRQDEVISTILGQKDCKIERGSMLQRILGTGVLYKLITKTFSDAGKNFHSDGNCTGCGTCMKLCPVSNIEMPGSKPEWKQHCVQCTACFNLCPKSAIQFKNVTIGKARYKNPYISPNDFR